MPIVNVLSIVLILLLALPAEAEQEAAPANEGDPKQVEAKQEKPSEPKKAKEGFQAVPEKKESKPETEQKKETQAAQKAAAAVKKVDAERKREVAVQREKALAEQNKAQVLQWRQQLQPVMINELNFVRQVCEIPQDQRAKVRAAGEKGLEAAALSFVQQQQTGRGADQLPISQEIQAGLRETLQAALPPEQFERYERELKARTEHRKRAAIASVVSSLEEALSLDVEQRKAITASIEAKWREPWESWLMLSRYSDQYFPEIPDEVVVPHLQQAQRALWKDLQKIQLGSFTGIMNQPVDDPEWWDKEQAPPVGPPDSVPVAAPAAEVNGEVAEFGKVFLEVLGAMFKAGGKK